MAEKKKTTKTTTTKTNNPYELPNGAIVNLDDEEWNQKEFGKLEDKQKLFILWYSTPSQDCYRNVRKAALKAGYSDKTAIYYNSVIKRNKGLENAIDYMSNKYTRTSIKDAYNVVMQDLIKCATYNVKDFYQSEEIEIPETGVKVVRTSLKNLDDIPDDVASVIDNIQINQSGIASAVIPSKEKARNTIMKIYNDMFQTKTDGDYDVETTVETIRDTLNQNKLTVRVTNKKVRDNASNYIENSEDQPDYD